MPLPCCSDYCYLCVDARKKPIDHVEMAGGWAWILLHIACSNKLRYYLRLAQSLATE